MNEPPVSWFLLIWLSWAVFHVCCWYRYKRLNSSNVFIFDSLLIFLFPFSLLLRENLCLITLSVIIYYNIGGLLAWWNCVGDRDLSTISWLSLHLSVGLWHEDVDFQMFLSLLQNTLIFPWSHGPFPGSMFPNYFLESFSPVDSLFSLVNTRLEQPEL